MGISSCEFRWIGRNYRQSSEFVAADALIVLRHIAPHYHGLSASPRTGAISLGEYPKDQAISCHDRRQEAADEVSRTLENAAQLRCFYETSC